VVWGWVQQGVGSLTNHYYWLRKFSKEKSYKKTTYYFDWFSSTDSRAVPRPLSIATPYSSTTVLTEDGHNKRQT